MKPLLYSALLVILSILSCTSQETDSVPYELQPEGLKKKIEGEVLEYMAQETLSHMHYWDSLFSNRDDIFWEYWGTYNLRITHSINGQISIREKEGQLENVRSEVVSHYAANAQIKGEDLNRYIQDANYPFYKYPFYGFASKEFIELKIEENEREFVESKELGRDDLAEYFKSQLNEWNKKLSCLEVLGGTELREIHYDMIVEVRDSVNEYGLSLLSYKAIEGLFDLRNNEAIAHFNESYSSLYFKATRLHDVQSRKRMTAIEHLIPNRVIDYGFAERNKLDLGWLRFELNYLEIEE